MMLKTMKKRKRWKTINKSVTVFDCFINSLMFCKNVLSTSVRYIFVIC